MAPIHNPYWEEVKDLLFDPARDRDATLNIRRPFCQRYCWTVPDPDTLEFVRSWLLPQAVEMGAGTGYWSWLLTQCGVRMTAFDDRPPHICPINTYHSPCDPTTGQFLFQLIKTYTAVKTGGPEKLVHPRYREHTLLLSWPPEADDMALVSLDIYTGHRLVYMGYPRGRYCATDGFFDQLTQEWQEVARRTPIRWQYVEDEVVVYERR